MFYTIHSNMQQPTTHLYRSLLRELRLHSRSPRSSRNPVVAKQFREMIDSAVTQPQPQNIDKAIIEARDFLRARRIHADLVKRYNPTSDMTQDERVHATARRVGLNTPIEYKA